MARTALPKAEHANCVCPRDIALWPKGPQKQSTFSAGSGYAITRDSKTADAAWIYINEYRWRLWRCSRLSATGQIFWIH